MKLLVLLAAVIAVAHSQIRYYEEQQKEYDHNAALTFKERLISLITRLALEANYYSKGHFIVSAHSIWYTLGSSVEDNEKELFVLLNLPDDQNQRQQFYSRSLLMEGSGFTRSRAIAVDETVPIKQDWYTFSDPSSFGMPSYLQSAVFDKPFGQLQKFVDYFSKGLPHSSHTVFVDHLMIKDEWNPALFDRTVQPGPFYNGQEPPAMVEYVRMKGRVRVAEYPQFKVLEVPVGHDDSGSMIFAVGDKPETMIEAILRKDVFTDLKLTEEPIEVIVPRMRLSSGMDFGPIFKNMNRSSVFSDPVDNRQSKSEIQVTPMGYFQIVSINIVDTEDRDDFNLIGLVEEKIDFTIVEADSFAVNKPFVFALFEAYPNTEVRIPVSTGVYTYPGEHGQQRVFI